MDDQNTNLNQNGLKDGVEESKSAIRTYESDAARALREKNGSIGSVFLAEQKKKVESSAVDSPSSSHGITYFFTSLFLIFLALGLSYGAYLYWNRDTKPLPSERNYTTAVISDKNILIQTEDVPRNEIIKKIITDKDEIREKQGTFSSFIFIKGEGELSEELKTDKLIERLGWRLPGRLERSLDGVFSLGLNSYSDKNEIFLVFTLSSYEQAFAGMLEWEKLMPSDLLPIFSGIKNDEAGATTIASSTPASTTTPSLVKISTSTASTTESSKFDEPLVFEDKVVRNKDVRVLKRGEKVLLVYAFPDRRTLVIAESEETLYEAISRLSPDRFKVPLYSDTVE